MCFFIKRHISDFILKARRQQGWTSRLMLEISAVLFWYLPGTKCVNFNYSQCSSLKNNNKVFIKTLKVEAEQNFYTSGEHIKCTWIIAIMITPLPIVVGNEIVTVPNKNCILSSSWLVVF